MTRRTITVTDPQGPPDAQAAAVAAAGLGAMYYVVGHNAPDLWGMTREAFALKAAAANVGNGPATELLTVAGREVTERHTGAASVDLKDKAVLRGLGLEQVGRALPVLATLSTEGADQVRTWILGITAGVAQASHDAGATEEISEAEHRALDAIAGVLDA
jgi:hypothetical protein